ncbi:MAG TPA: hypothetical protein VGQ34_01790, partial [Sphingomicrobium sp.]|nr:hypothetical protein [Sphingomicrobium sp.]
LVPYATWKSSGATSDRWIMSALLGCALLLTAARHGAFTILSLILLLPLLNLGVRALLGGIAAVLLFAPVTWWAPNLQLGPAATVSFVVIGAAAAFLPRLGAAGPSNKAAPSILPTMAVALLIGLFVGLLTAPFGSREPIYFAWHHWGAYLAPVDAWLAGGLPYRDFPLQYGIGPTVLLAAVCGPDCWRGVYYATILANALYFSVLAGCAAILTAGRPRGLRWLTLAALFCASFVWTAFPADLGSTAMTPSVAGLRFLPIALLLFYILNAERSGKRSDWVGHAIWLCDLLWSPEGAFFGTLIWWSYLAMRDAGNASAAGEAWVALLRGALRGLIALAGGLIVLALVLWLVSKGAARPTDFLAYILYPPGPLPINPTGTIWLALAGIVLALHSLVGTGRLAAGRSIYASLLGFLAAGTYYLSRSHDNNILNLFPLLVILLVASLRTDGTGDAPPVFGEAFVRTVLAAMVAFIAAAGWSSWADGAKTEGLLNIGPSRLIAHFNPEPGNRPQLLSSDALKGLAYLHSRNAGAVVLLDENRLIPAHLPGQDWTGVNNAANFEPLPPALVTRFICRGAEAYRRPGWLLVDERKYSAWVPMFEEGYEVREEVGFGTYRAYLLSPRSGPLKCAGL